MGSFHHLFWINYCIWKHIFDFTCSRWSMKFLGGGSLRNVGPLQCPPHSPYTHTHPAACFLLPPPTFVSSQTKGLVRAQERRAGGGRVHQTQGQGCFVNNKCGGEGRDGRAQRLTYHRPEPDMMFTAQANLRTGSWEERGARPYKGFPKGPTKPWVSPDMSPE